MLSEIPFLTDWNKIGDYGQCQTDLIRSMKIRHAGIGTTKLVIKYCYGEIVSSANQKVVMNVIVGLSHQFIQTGQLGFNVEQDRND
jgi:hypothetical protein